VLIDALENDALRDSAHDFGKDDHPRDVRREPPSMAYDFSLGLVPGETRTIGYWRDVGTIDSYWDASMDLISIAPPLNLYNQRWPIRSAPLNFPPAKFVFAEADRIGRATNSLVSAGVIISGGYINQSILSPRVRIHSYSEVEGSILMDGVEVGRRAKVRRTIVDKGVKIPPGTYIGFDLERDRERFTVTDSGLVVVPKGTVIEE
jgi:glucose-1-phosphate adenylyltransferase